MVQPSGRARWRRTGAIFAVLFTLGLLASACGTSNEPEQGQGGTDSSVAPGEDPVDVEPDAGPPQPGGKLAYGLVAETDGWDPSVARWAASGFQVANAIYDRLGAFNTDYEVKPFLLESITPNEDFTQWTLGVRDGPTFHNGEPVTAEAIATNLETFRNGALTRTAMENIIGPIEANADGDVIVNTSVPWSTYPLQLTAQIGYIIPPDMLGADETMTKPIGSGPFKFTDWQTGSKLTVTKNAEYWRDGLPYLDSIEFQVVTDNQARRSALQTGGLDIAEFFDVESINEFRADTSGDFNVLSDPAGEDEEALIMLNTDVAPFDNVKARQALAMATDVPDVTAFIGEGLEPAMGPFSEGSRWYAEGVGNPAYNLEDAKALVQQVKDEGDGTFAFTLTGVPVVETQRFAQYLQQMWKEAGIDVTLEDTEQATLINLAVAGDFQAVTWRQFGSAHPDGEYVWTHGKNAKPVGEISLNFARNDDEELNAALDAARASGEFDTQKAQYDIWQQRLAETVPYIWIYHVKAVVVARNNVHDVTKGMLPDGQPQLSMTSVVHPVAQIWIDQ